MAIEDDAFHDLFFLRSHDIAGNVLDSGRWFMQYRRNTRIYNLLFSLNLHDLVTFTPASLDPTTERDFQTKQKS